MGQASARAVSWIFFFLIEVNKKSSILQHLEI